MGVGVGVGVCVRACVCVPVQLLSHPWILHPLPLAQLLGLGTSKGKLHVFALGSGEMSAVTQFTAHEAQDGEQDPQFGQLSKQ